MEIHNKQIIDLTAKEISPSVSFADSSLIRWSIPLPRDRLSAKASLEPHAQRMVFVLQ